MIADSLFRGDKGPLGRGVACSKSKCWNRGKNGDHDGFTLVELLIVVTILPLIVGALSVGLMSVFSLQSGVSSRLSDTQDSQAVAASYQNDVQSAAYVTEQGGLIDECSSVGSLLLALEWDPNTSGGGYYDTVSYVSVPVVSPTGTTYSLERLSCTGGTFTPTSTTTLAVDLPSSQVPPTVTCTATVTNCSNVTTGWYKAQYIATISFPVTEPKSSYSYTLVSSPEASTAAPDTGSPITANTNTSCNFASPNTGTYAANLCFVDFSVLTGAAMQDAENGCLELSVSLPNNYILYFCVNIAGSTVFAANWPTWQYSFLGNSIGGQPFYTGVPNGSALYQNEAGTTTVTFNNISVVSPSDTLATGWEAVSADAESSDDGESIQWTVPTSSNPPGEVLTVLPNGESGQTQPVGNACDNGTTLTGSGTYQVTCLGDSLGQKTGAAMVWAPAPQSMTVTMVGTGLEAITFGLLLS